MTKEDWIQWCILRSGIEYPSVKTIGKNETFEGAHQYQFFDHPEFGTIVIYSND